jgi:cytochrome b561
MSTPKRYHPLLVTLHWLSALLVIFMLLFGMFYLKRLPNNDAKIMPLVLHMLTGLTILVLTSVRLVTRLVTKKPAPATTGNRFLDFIGILTHWLLYIGLFGMGLSGLGIAFMSGILPWLVGGQASFPAGGFYAFSPRIGHQYVALGLLALIGLHVAAALYHQLIRKDGLFSRMGFGKKEEHAKASE